MNELPQKKLVADSFGRAASHYDDVAVLQRQTADELLQRLDQQTIKPETIVDLGTGTGRNLSLLMQRYPQAQLIAVDIATGMLKKAQKTYAEQQALNSYLQKTKSPLYLAGDAELLPLADNSVDLVFANLALQWCDPVASFAEIERILKPGGLVMFSSLGAETLYELRQSWASVDNYPHINTFNEADEIDSASMQAGFSRIEIDSQPMVLFYKTAMALMRDLKILGARNLNRQRRRGLTGKHALTKVQKAYEVFRRDEMLPATYDVLYGYAYAGLSLQQTSLPIHDGNSVNHTKREIL